MIKSKKGKAQTHISRKRADNFSGSSNLGGNRGIRFKAKSFLDKRFVPEVFPDSYTLQIGPKRNPVNAHKATTDERFSITQFKEKNPDLAGNAVRGKKAISRLGTDFRGQKPLKFNPLAEKQYALSENAGKETGGEQGRSFKSEVRPTRAMRGQGIRIGRHIPATKELEAVLDVDYAEDKYRIDLQDEQGNQNYEKIRIKHRK